MKCKNCGTPKPAIYYFSGPDEDIFDYALCVECDIETNLGARPWWKRILDKAELRLEARVFLNDLDEEEAVNG